MGDYIKFFLVAAALFCGLDYIWLGRIAKRFYQEQMGNMLSKKPNLTAAAAFYVLFIIGLLVFAVVPTHHAGRPVLSALTRGGLYGFFTYCTYDLTNLATLKGWPVQLALVDIAWGVVLSASIAALTALITF